MAKSKPKSKPKPHGSKKFLTQLAPHIIADLQPPTEIKKFTGNTAVVGAYVEGAVRELVRRQVHPLQVATGAVIDEMNTPGDPRLPQLDTIVWAPSPAPAVFQVGDFALVPRSSSFGVLEIKASAYDTIDLDKRLSKTLARKVTADPLPNEKKDLADFVPSLGVICLRTKKQNQKRIMKMKNAGRVVVLFEEKGRRIVPRPTDIWRLVNFLGRLRLRGRFHQGIVEINIDILK